MNRSTARDTVRECSNVLERALWVTETNRCEACFSLVIGQLVSFFRQLGNCRQEWPIEQSLMQFTNVELKALANYIGSIDGDLQVVPQSRFR